VSFAAIALCVASQRVFIIIVVVVVVVVVYFVIDSVRRLLDLPSCVSYCLNSSVCCDMRGFYGGEGKIRGFLVCYTV
jgi:hypothetical protein